MNKVISIEKLVRLNISFYLAGQEMLKVIEELKELEENKKNGER